MADEDVADKTTVDSENDFRADVRHLIKNSLIGISQSLIARKLGKSEATVVRWIDTSPIRWDDISQVISAALELAEGKNKLDAVRPVQWRRIDWWHKRFDTLDLLQPSPRPEPIPPDPDPLPVPHPPRRLALIAAACVAGLVLVGGGVWLSVSGATGTSTPPATQNSSSPQSSGGGLPAHVAWTTDGGSTLLRSYDSPNPGHRSVGAYNLGDPLTVQCKSLNGDPITVGAAYTGPDPHSTTWYRISDGTWVPAVYTKVDNTSAVPTC